MSGRNIHPSATENICVDRNAKKTGHSTNHNGRLLYLVEVQCGSLPCPQYVNNREFTCVVCTKENKVFYYNEKKILKFINVVKMHNEYFYGLVDICKQSLQLVDIRRHLYRFAKDEFFDMFKKFTPMYTNLF